MGTITRTKTTSEDLAVVEIEDDYSVSLTQGQFVRTIERYSPDEARQLARELNEAADGADTIRETDERAASTQLESDIDLGIPHTAVVVENTLRPGLVISHHIECPECDLSWGEGEGSDLHLQERADAHNNSVGGMF